MFTKKGKTFIEIFLFLVVLALFCYFRLKPLYLQTVSFTYDQGRDMLKAAEIIMQKNPTLIGPTTGIGGVFHGAWWFYFLAVAFAIFQGLPIGYYYLFFFIHLLAFLVFYFFTKKWFGASTALLLSLLITASPHFVYSSVFLNNSLISYPLFMALTLITIAVLEKKLVAQQKWLFLGLGLTLGFITEFEFAFGLLLIPSYMLLLFLFKNYRQKLLSDKHCFFFAAGLLFPFIHRVLFEIKNRLIQTQVLINFFFHPKYYNPKPYLDVFFDRLKLFADYYSWIYPNKTIQTVFGLFLLLGLVLVILNIKKRKQLPSSLLFLLSLGILLFICSVFYRDNFWAYYYDGILYLFIFIFALILQLPKSFAGQFQYLKKAVIIVLFISILSSFFRDWKTKSPYDGIKVQQDIVSYVIAKKTGSNYCVKVYTPPVIPYTYDYLFLYEHLHNQQPQPSGDWINGQCFFIIEADSYQFRRDKWLTDNRPKSGQLLSRKKIKDVDIELWKKTN